MIIANESVVTVNYTLKNDTGEILDTSEGREPLVYLHGVGALIPGLENELAGKSADTKLKVVITPENAYGTRRDELVRVVSKDGFQGEEELTVGMRVQLDTEHGPAIAEVTKVEEEVTLDLNHPLADMTLHFDVEIIEVRAASAEEIEHGHVHGEGGHHH
ncbi:MAG: FKBP-type peptidyl-prolyl cis-trans isomerase SlyD [Crocinitomix sp.]|jgi:FKBP-type peptidyl-prolyl cis-trans isomerase SlyD